MEAKENDGNFRALLRYRVNCAVDEVLEAHISKASSRATHLSPKTQNIFIQCCAEEILSKVIVKVQAAKIYYVMFDETTNLSSISQLHLLVRYTDCKKIYESFWKFIDVRANDVFEPDDAESKITGVKVGKTVTQELKSFNLDLKFCVGITLDGYSAMVSEARGAIATIQKEAVNAVFCPCLKRIKLIYFEIIQSYRN